MKTRKGILVVAAILVFCASTVLADGVTYRSTRVGKILVTSYNKENKCRMVCKGSKPFMEYVADGLAYTLDIPLAILSPFTCLRDLAYHGQV